MKYIFLCITLYSSITVSIAQITPFEVLPHIMKGINLGNTLEPPAEGKWNDDDPIEWSDNGQAEEYYFDAYKEAGFQSVRIPITWHTHTSEDFPFAIDVAWLERVDEIVNWALQRNLYVIINAHHETWLKENYANEIYRERFDSIWSQVATYFKDKPEQVLFEILNEPYGMTIQDVNDLNVRILSIIRKTNPTRIVFFSGNSWANIEHLEQAAIPQDNYLMAYYHSYEPWNFAGMGQGTWGSNSDIAALQKRIQKGAAWVEKNNIPLVISEFGTDTLCDYNSRMLFLAYYVEEAGRLQIAWNVWDDGGTFQVYRRKTNTWHDTKELLLHFSHLSPNQLVLNPQSNSVMLTWNNRLSSDAVLQIERRGSFSSFEKIAELTGATTSYTDEQLLTSEYYYYRIKAILHDSVYYSYPQRILIVAPESDREPFYGTPFVVPTVFKAVDFDKGGFGLTYFDADVYRTNTLYRPELGVDIDTLYADYYVIHANALNEWFEYSIDVPESGNYVIAPYISSLQSKGTVSISVNGVIRNKTIQSTGAYDVFVPMSVTMPIAEGTHIVRIKVVKQGDFFIDSIAIYKDVVSDLPIRNSKDLVSVIHRESRQLEFCFDHTVQEPVRIEFYSVLGNKISESVLFQTPYVCSMQSFVHGVYFAKVFFGNQTFICSFVIE